MTSPNPASDRFALDADGVATLAPCTADARRRSSLSSAERDEMFALLCRHFDGVTRAQFLRDLDEKDWVLRIRRDERLVGFTTLQVYDAAIDGRLVHVIYSGDTITDPEVWGSPVLARAWIALVRRIQGARVAEPWYWLLLSSGFRTYRLLPVFFQQFWPRHDTRTPSSAACLLARLAAARFGPHFDQAAGIVRFDQPQRLRPGMAAVPEGKWKDAHVTFFIERNPGHAAGDELVCLADLGDANLTAAGRRMLRIPAP